MEGTLLAHVRQNAAAAAVDALRSRAELAGTAKPRSNAVTAATPNHPQHTPHRSAAHSGRSTRSPWRNLGGARSPEGSHTAEGRQTG